MRYLSPYFWICFGLFCANQAIEKWGIHLPFVHAYLDDLLTAGIVMGFALMVQQQFTYRNPNYTFKIGHSIFFVLWYSLLFEVVFPSFDTRHYADLVDCLMYALGAVGFHRWGNKPTSKLLLNSSLIKNLIK